MSALSPRLIAMQGLGGTPRLVAVQGLAPAAAPSPFPASGLTYSPVRNPLRNPLRRVVRW